MNYSNTDNKDKQEVLRDIHNGKEKKWRIKKMNSLLLADSYERLENFQKLGRVVSCAHELYFETFADGSKRLKQADFCRVRLCPICAWRRSLKIFGQVSKIMNYLEEKTSYKYLFLTLTQKNVTGPELSGEIDRLFYAFKKFIQNKKFKAISKGWFRALEITHNIENGDYHPHFHMVIAVNKSYFKDSGLYINQMQWSELWRQSLEVDYTPIVDVRTVKQKEGEKYSKAVAEIAKYTVKDSDYIIQPAKEFKQNKELEKFCQDMTDEVVEILDAALHGRRLISFGGEIKEIHKKLNLDDALDGDLINCDIDKPREDLAEMIIKYRWFQDNYYRED
jgi:plasmid rolling circle replication initiator protein Rep